MVEEKSFHVYSSISLADARFNTLLSCDRDNTVIQGLVDCQAFPRPGQQIRSKIDSFQNANFFISKLNPMMLLLIGIVSERRFQWGSHHRVWLRNEKVIMKTVFSLFLNYSPARQFHFTQIWSLWKPLVSDQHFFILAIYIRLILKCYFKLVSLFTINYQYF